MAPLSRPPMTTCQFFGWQYPLYTGKYLAIIVATLLAVKIDITSYFFKAAYLVLAAGAAAEYSGKLVTGQGFVTKYVGAPRSCAKCVKESLLPAVGDYYECFEKKALSIIYVEDPVKTAKAAFVAYILSFVTSIVSVYTLIWAGVVFMFGFPPIYQSNQDEIDAAVAHAKKAACAKLHELKAEVETKACPLVKQIVEKSGPLGAFIQSKIPIRTAGSTVGETPVVSTSAAEPSTAFSSGASKFPEVPATELKSTVTEVEEKAPVAESL